VTGCISVPAPSRCARIGTALLPRGAPVTPRLSLALGALAVAALVNLALRLFHAGDISLMVLAWHFGGALILSLVGSQLGNTLLNWRSLIARSEVATIRMS
jgi:negative regulator of sigma F NrsF-like protein